MLKINQHCESCVYFSAVVIVNHKEDVSIVSSWPKSVSTLAATNANVKFGYIFITGLTMKMK